MSALKRTIENYSVSVAIVMIAMFLTFGVVYAANEDAFNCGIGAVEKDADGTPLHNIGDKGRKDDNGWKIICSAEKAQHNR